MRGWVRKDRDSTVQAVKGREWTVLQTHSIWN